MKVVLLTNDTPKAKCLEVLLLNQGINIEKVIVFSRQKSQKNGSVAVRVLKLIFRRLQNWLSTRSSEAKALEIEKQCRDICEKKLVEYLYEITSDIDGFNTTESVVVSDINSLEVETILKQIRPDLCVVWGTPILKTNILNLAPRFVNAHTSILPHYKGTFSEFWQCYNNDIGSVGVTFHLVDNGIDTGPIIYQVFQDIKGPLEPFSLRLNNTKLILQYYPGVVEALSVGGLNIQEQSLIEVSSIKTYRSSDITIEKRIELYSRLKCKHNHLPELIEKLPF